MPEPDPKQSLNLAEYVARSSQFPIGKIPETVQALVARELAQYRNVWETPPVERSGSRIMWRLTWLKVRTILLIPSRLGEESVARWCEDYFLDLLGFARTRYADADPLTLRDGVLRAATEIDVRHWTILADRIEHLNLPPLPWLERDVDEILWIRFCGLCAVAAWSKNGRQRSRREVAEIMAAADIGPQNSTTIRLNLLPKVEQTLLEADRWAATLGNSPKDAAPFGQRVYPRKSG